MADDNQTANIPQDIKKNKALMDQIALVSFIDDLIKERKDPNIKPENLPRVKELLLKEVNNAINTHMISLLSEKDQVDLDVLLDKNPTDDELNNFFTQKISNLEAEIAAALLNFRTIYLYPVSKQIKEAVSLSSSLSPLPVAPAPVGEKKVN